MDVEHVPLRARTESPSRCLQVYVDDFCFAATQSMDGKHIPTISRAGIHSIHSLFPPPEVTKHENGKPPLSQKKLHKGEGQWRVEKEKVVSCSMVGGEPSGCQKKKQSDMETKQLLNRKRTPVKKFQTTVGRLRHASVILPAAAGFSHLSTMLLSQMNPGTCGNTSALAKTQRSEKPCWT
ncbi:LOW QUALITY PROTEIN: hypothetical protein ACHAXR_004124 [Thalassiosira sp. AJA248-18]